MAYSVLVAAQPESQSWSQLCIPSNSNNVHEARGCAAAGWSMQHAHIAPSSTLPHVSIPQLVLRWAVSQWKCSSSEYTFYYSTEGQFYCSFFSNQLHWCCDHANREPLSVTREMGTCFMLVSLWYPSTNLRDAPGSYLHSVNWWKLPSSFSASLSTCSLRVFYFFL